MDELEWLAERTPIIKAPRMDTQPTKRRFSFIEGVTVEPVLFLYMLATFMQYTVFQDLVFKKVCYARPNIDLTVCNNVTGFNDTSELSAIQQTSSHWILLSTVSLTFPSIIVSNFLGVYSDTHGRKLPLVLPSVGMILSCILYILMAAYPTVPIDFIILANVLSGIFGGFVSCIMAVMSYVSTISTVENRTMRVGLLESMTFLGGTIGPFIGGAIFTATNSHSIVFLVILCCHAVISLYVILLVPDVKVSESQKENRDDVYGSTCRKYMSCENFIGSVRTVFRKRNDQKRLCMILLLLAAFVVMVITAGEMDVALLYTRNIPLLWNYETYSYYFGLKYGLGAFALLSVMPLAQRFSIRDTILAVAGIFSKLAGLVLHGLSTNSIMMFLVAPVSMFSTLCIPSIRAQLSKMVDDNEQGKLFAFVASVENLCTLFGSLIFNSIYPLSLTFFNGFIFELAAGLLLIPLVLIGAIHYISDPNSNLDENGLVGADRRSTEEIQ